MISKVSFRPYSYYGRDNQVLMNYYSGTLGTSKNHKFHEDELPEIWKEIGRYLAEKHKREANIE